MKEKMNIQHYRKAWENCVEFKNWLTSIPNDQTKSYCKCCKQVMLAHKLTLLKHCSSIKHMRNESKIESSLSKPPTLVQNNVDTQLAQSPTTNISEFEEDLIIEETDENQHQSDCNIIEEENFNSENNCDSEQAETASQSQIIEESEYIDDLIACDIIEMSGTARPPISTHILDTSRGQAAADIPISLYKWNEETKLWISIGNGITNSDGRCNDLLTHETFIDGQYKLHFDVDVYFKRNGTKSLYPFIEIVFNCEALAGHYHIPLLLNPFGYSTYRGT